MYISICIPRFLKAILKIKVSFVNIPSSSNKEQIDRKSLMYEYHQLLIEYELHRKQFDVDIYKRMKQLKSSSLNSSNFIRVNLANHGLTDGVIAFLLAGTRLLHLHTLFHTNGLRGNAIFYTGNPKSSQKDRNHTAVLNGFLAQNNIHRYMILFVLVY